MSEYDDAPMYNVQKIIGLVFLVILLITALTWGSSALCRYYDVWAEHKAGEAELARASSNRQIKTLEAEAKMESAKYLAEAEIIRAEGVAEANRIIGNSLEGNEAYLRYLWIHGLGEGGNQVIYVPTECQLPILEATRNIR